MSSHVGHVVFGDFLQEKEAIAEELGGQQASSATETNFSFKQDKPRCM
jgi:hypothetical protein